MKRKVKADKPKFRRQSWWGLNRTLCGVLEDMRKCVETHNYAPMKSLIEEAQIMGNRMEAALDDKKDIPAMEKYRHELKADIRRLNDEHEKLAPDAD